ncbi:MAG: hypothetical protein JNL18_01910 [Planctomycetaceae bacterium]|nr:hypothetical protein [Planctomycetaceae bacterium]
MSRLNHASFFRHWTVAVPTTGAVGAGLMVALAGCSGGPSRVQPPSISPSGAASEAMTAYDKDSDGFIAGPELDAAPGLKAAMATLDLDKDGKVSEDEISQRIEAWQATGLGIMSITCRVTMDGKPVDGATVTFEPETFLGENVKAGEGTTSGGMASIRIPKENRPSADYPPGMQFGLFKVKVSKQANGKETIPAKYNTETTLGQQVSSDDPAIMSQLIKFDLTSK